MVGIRPLSWSSVSWAAWGVSCPSADVTGNIRPVAVLGGNKNVPVIAKFVVSSSITFCSSMLSFERWYRTIPSTATCNQPIHAPVTISWSRSLSRIRTLIRPHYGDVENRWDWRRIAYTRSRRFKMWILSHRPFHPFETWEPQPQTPAWNPGILRAAWDAGTLGSLLGPAVALVSSSRSVACIYIFISGTPC